MSNRFPGKTMAVSNAAANIAIESMDINLDVEEIDVTGNDSAGVGEFEAGISSGTAEVNGFAKGTLAASVPGTAVSGGVFSTGGSGAPKVTASGFVKSLKISSSIKGAVQANVGYRFSGAVVVGTV